MIEEIIREIVMLIIAIIGYIITGYIIARKENKKYEHNRNIRR